MSAAGQKYWLSAHVHACVTGDYAVLLDLRRDKYIGIAREHMPTLAASVIGWPSTEQEQVASVPRAAALLDKLLSTGVLTADSASGKEARSPAVPSPQRTAIEADLEDRPRVAARDVCHVLFAAAKARALLKWRSIESVVTRVQQRKQQCGVGRPFDLDAASPIVAAFLYLRPLFFTTKDECLFDSLVLVELLARSGHYPDWLFGVSTSPFSAHSWVQAGDRVLNDQPERVSRFTPILVV